MKERETERAELRENQREGKYEHVGNNQMLSEQLIKFSIFCLLVICLKLSLRHHSKKMHFLYIYNMHIIYILISYNIYNIYKGNILNIYFLM